MVPGRERVFLCSSALRMLESTRYPIVAPQATQSVSCKSAVTALSSIEDDRKHTHISSDVTLICTTGGNIAHVHQRRLGRTAILRLSLVVNLSCLHNFNTVNPLDRNRDLLNTSAKNLAEFLHTDLDVGLTFTERAKLKKQLGEMQGFERNKQKAARALESVRHFVDRLSDAEAKAAIRSRCLELERAISAL